MTKNKNVRVILHVIGRVHVQMDLSKCFLYQEKKSDLSYIMVDVN